MTRKPKSTCEPESKPACEPTRPLTEREQRFIQMYASGMSFQEIGQSCDPPLTRSRIAQILARCIKNGHHVVQGHRERESILKNPEYDKRILELWPKNGICNISELARTVGVGMSIINRVRKRYNLPYVKHYPLAKIPPDHRDTVCEEYVSGITVAELLRKYDVSPSSIYRILYAKYKTLEAAKAARDANLKAKKQKNKTN